ncbi:MAG: hypothetical protein Q4C83_03515 [Candidatus Saccharibacteria bacterium]|nr:hypothetical protein [Candidatus Saccharibacteria bacterium]
MKKQLAGALFTAGLLLLSTVPAFAGQWIGSTETGWRYQQDDGSYMTGTNAWIDGNQDGWYEFYSFDANGDLVTDRDVVDEFRYNSDGQWSQNGVVDRRRVYDIEQFNPYYYDLDYMLLKYDYITQLNNMIADGSFQPGASAGTITLTTSNVFYSDKAGEDLIHEKCSWVLREAMDIIADHGWTVESSFRGNDTFNGSTGVLYYPYLKITLAQ